MGTQNLVTGILNVDWYTKKKTKLERTRFGQSAAVFKEKPRRPWTRKDLNTKFGRPSRETVAYGRDERA